MSAGAAPRQHETNAALLAQATRGLDLTEWELRILDWLAGWEPETCEAIANIIDKAKAST